MGKALNAGSSEILNARIRALTAEHTPKWGRFTVAQMVAHLTQSLEISLAQQPVVPQTKWMARLMVLPLLKLGVLPIPKGKVPTTPEFLRADATELETERERFFSALTAFTAALTAEPRRLTVHPAFGKMRLRTWAQLHWHHFDHHLRQFGV